MDTTSGAEHLVVNQRSLTDDKLEIGYSIIAAIRTCLLSFHERQLTAHGEYGCRKLW